MEALLEKNREIIARYAGQPGLLPGELRARIEGDVKGKPQGAQWTWTTSSLDH